MSTDKEDNREEESSHIEHPVHNTFTMPATGYVDRDNTREE